jgi:voltage-gated potassium channel
MESPAPTEASAEPVAASRLQVFRAIVRAPDSYGLLFVFLIVYYVLLTINWNSRLSLLVRVAWLCVTTLLAFYTSRVPRRVMTTVIVATGLTFVAAVVVILQGHTQADGGIVLLASVLVLSTPFAVGWRNLKHTTVTGETIMGALCIYVLIGLIFATFDYGFQLAANRPYFAQPGQHGPSDFVYFSYITMSTVGYGDLTPAPGLPRTTAALEALMGQIFLVVLVARLVAMYTPSVLRRAEIGEELSRDTTESGGQSAG